MNSVKKGAAYVLSILVLIFAILAILGVWEVIDIKDILGKMFNTMLIILATTAVVVFIFAILLRDSNKFEDN